MILVNSINMNPKKHSNMNQVNTLQLIQINTIKMNTNQANMNQVNMKVLVKYKLLTINLIHLKNNRKIKKQFKLNQYHFLPN